MNVIAAAIWGPLFVGLGYLFGHGIEAMLGHVHGARHVILLAVIAAVIAIGAIQAMRWWRTREAG